MIVKKIDKVLRTVEKVMIEVLFFVMILVVLAAVLNRMTVNRQMAWSDEFSRYVFIWMTFIAAAYASGEKAHIGVTALLDILPHKIQHVVEVLLYFLCLVFSAAIFVYSIRIMQTQIAFGQLSPSLRLPMQYAYLGMTIGSGFMALHYILHIINYFLPKPTQLAEKKEDAES